jgi:hypothetical protein
MDSLIVQLFKILEQLIPFPAQFLFPLGAPPFLPLAIDALALASDLTLPILDVNNATGTSPRQ